MISLVLRTAIALVLVAASSAMAADPEVCTRPENDLARQAEKLQGLTTRIESLSQDDTGSRFAACPSKSHNLTKPDVGWFQRSIAAQDSNGVKTRDFLDKLLARLDDVAQENVNLSKNIGFCMGAKGDTPGCAKMRKEWIEPDGGLKFKIEEARYHLALAQGPQDPRTVFGAANEGINKRMTTTGVHKDVPWKPLTPAEEKAATEILRREEKKVRDKVLARGYNGHSYASRRLFQDEMMVIRKGHWNEYRKVLSSVPFVQFISSLNPSDKEIAEAARKQGELALKEQKKLREFRWKLKSKRTKEINTDLLDMLEYRSIVEDLLTVHPEYCGVAAGLAEVRDQRALGTAAATMTGLIVLSVLVPPAAGIALGVGASGVAAYEAYDDFHKARQMALSEVIAEKGAPDATELNERRQGFEQAATVGVAMGGAMGGVTSRGAQAVRSQKLFSALVGGGRAETRRVPQELRKSAFE
jgi:hypothetical protein